ncbi:hypothetical protein CYMTET_10140 [Cymbomonas tetramitiformis]|uniref:Trafficking protein particle complex subunit 12 n=1 Tax=Cymbomonas tetramitiformis TaxID=36881 RepID=A0AAE0GQ49_9CHLO|nr:hypothetical protein CYMTET_10140 [Cymbomonas tetramitiformis]
MSSNRSPALPSAGQPIREAATSHPLQGLGGDPPEPDYSNFSSVSLPNVKRLGADSVPEGTDGLRVLALQGSWRPLVQSAKDMLANSASLSEAKRLVCTSYYVLGLSKLRMYAAAIDEIKALGDLDQPKYCAPAGAGATPASLVPFALRFLAAELPHRLGQTQATMDSLYLLMQWCREQAIAAMPQRSANGKSQAEEQPDISTVDCRTWTRRQEMVLYQLLNHHLVNKDFGVVLQWLDSLLLRHPNDPVIASRIGYVLLQLGDVDGAKQTFLSVESEVESYLEDPLEKHTWLNLVHRNKGLLKFAQKDFSTALCEFRVALEYDSTDVASLNNHALCLMYTRDLMGATRFLEESIQSDPLKYLDETLVLNLCSMYELAWVSGTDNKRKLSSWISKIAPDDFDLNCTRL